MEIKKYCKWHGETDHVLRNDGRFRCKKCCVIAVSKRRVALKIKALKYKGNKCSICNYDKCKDALEFHHINPLEKEFGIANRIIRSWVKVKNELDKCILLCANCHRELHNIPIIQIQEKEKTLNLCPICNSTVNNNNKIFCSSKCFKVDRIKNIPEKSELIDKIILYKSNLKVGKYYNVSDNTIKKWKIRYNL